MQSRQKRAAVPPRHLCDYVVPEKKQRTDPTERTETAPAVVPTPDIDVGQTSADESSMLPDTAEEAGLDAGPPEIPEHEVPAMVIPTEVHYNVIEGGSQRGGPLLVDSTGYSYNYQRTGPSCKFWRCSRRGKADRRCFATVQQRGNLFTRGPQDHNHHLTPDIETKVCLLLQCTSVSFLSCRQHCILLR